MHPAIEDRIDPIDALACVRIRLSRRIRLRVLVPRSGRRNPATTTTTMRACVRARVTSGVVGPARGDRSNAPAPTRRSIPCMCIQSQSQSPAGSRFPVCVYSHSHSLPHLARDLVVEMKRDDHRAWYPGTIDSAFVRSFVRSVHSLTVERTNEREWLHRTVLGGTHTTSHRTVTVG